MSCVNELAVSMRKECVQTTFRKCADNVQERDWEGYAENVRLRAGGLTPIERLRGARMCADSGRTHADNVQ